MGAVLRAKNAVRRESGCARADLGSSQFRRSRSCESAAPPAGGSPRTAASGSSCVPGHRRRLRCRGFHKCGDFRQVRRVSSAAGGRDPTCPPRRTAKNPSRLLVRAGPWPVEGSRSASLPDPARYTRPRAPHPGRDARRRRGAFGLRWTPGRQRRAVSNPPDFSARLTERIQAAGLRLLLENAELDRLDRYYEVLTKWNRTINLTSLPLEGFPSRTIDRLFIESFLAAEHINDSPAVWLDLGSGGGSPAITL